MECSNCGRIVEDAEVFYDMDDDLEEFLCDECTADGWSDISKWMKKQSKS